MHPKRDSGRTLGYRRTDTHQTAAGGWGIAVVRDWDDPLRPLTNDELAQAVARAVYNADSVVAIAPLSVTAKTIVSAEWR